MATQIDPTQTWDFAFRSSDIVHPRSENGPLDYQSILVPIDFSEHSKRTIQHATRLASVCGATVILLHVYRVRAVVAPISHGTSLPTGELVCTENEAREKLAKVAKEVRGSGVDVIELLRTGSAPQQIAEVACQLNVDLIVIGSHGNSRIKHLVLGSTAEKVVQDAPCPVFVVKSRSSRGDFLVRKTALQQSFLRYGSQRREAVVTGP